MTKPPYDDHANPDVLKRPSHARGKAIKQAE